jgi:hypothetical protein
MLSRSAEWDSPRDITRVQSKDAGRAWLTRIVTRDQPKKATIHTILRSVTVSRSESWGKSGLVVNAKTGKDFLLIGPTAAGE